MAMTIGEVIAALTPGKKKPERMTKELRKLVYHRQRRELKAQQRAERGKMIVVPEWRIDVVPPEQLEKVLNAEEAREQRRIARRRRMKRRGWC